MIQTKSNGPLTFTGNASAPARDGNVNRSPKSQGDWSSRVRQSFPKDYGIKSKRFGTEVYVPSKATLAIWSKNEIR